MIGFMRTYTRACSKIEIKPGSLFDQRGSPGGEYAPAISP